MKMKKFLSLFLCLMMLFSICVSAYAAPSVNGTCSDCSEILLTCPSCSDIGAYCPSCNICIECSYTAPDYSTEVTYTGQGQESYTLTVPATLAPGGSGTVKLEGTWSSATAIEVSADYSVALFNSIDNGRKDLSVYFDKFSQIGDNTKSISVSKTISVGNITKALFGTWEGTIDYYVTPITNGVTFTINGVSYTVPEGSFWTYMVDNYGFGNSDPGSAGYVLNQDGVRVLYNENYNEVRVSEPIESGAYYFTTSEPA